MGLKKSRVGREVSCGACSKTFKTRGAKPSADGVVRCPACAKVRANELRHARAAKQGQSHYERYAKGNPKYSKKRREWQLQTNYGLSLEAYDQILDRQGGVCAICKGTESEKKHLVVDHDHQTGKVRGLLCNPCNRAIGQLKDDPKRLHGALSYLRRHDPRRTWDSYFVQIAELVATRSKDPSTQVGAVLVRDRMIVSTGYNGFPRGVNDNVPERYDRPEKYMWTVHSEENALLAAARNGIRVDGCTLYVTPWFPCARCATSIVQAGVKEVVSPGIDRNNPRWIEQFQLSAQILEAGHVLVRAPDA